MTAGEMAKGKPAGVTDARLRPNEAVLAHGHHSRSVSDEVSTPVSAVSHGEPEWVSCNGIVREPIASESRALTAKGQPSVGIVNPRWLAGAGVAVALATAASMSAGGRAREMIIVNGDREFAARFVIIEQREQISF